MKPFQAIIKTGMMLLFILLNLPVQAQKLSNIQEGSVWAPENVKIDGKLKEWGNTLQAYNRTTGLYYTMANDDKNLYFIMRSSDQIINNKFIGGGIDITISTTGNKKDKNAYVVEYPLVDMDGLRRQVTSMRSNTAQAPPSGAPGMSGMDSATVAMRRRALSTIKELKLTGFAADVPDQVISVYNAYGIKTAVDYDANGNLSCEIAIPLKYLHLNGNDFAYNIKMNGINLLALMHPEMNTGNAMAGGGNGGGGGFADRPAPPPGDMTANMARAMNDMENMVSPTDFWGKYVLAKK
jgi:YD repeat-containing protein